MKFSLPNYEMETPVFGIRKNNELQVRTPPPCLKEIANSPSGATYIFPLMFAIFNAVYWVLYLYVIRSFGLYLFISVSI